MESWVQHSFDWVNPRFDFEQKHLWVRIFILVLLKVAQNDIFKKYCHSSREFEPQTERSFIPLWTEDIQFMFNRLKSDNYWFFYVHRKNFKQTPLFKIKYINL